MDIYRDQWDIEAARRQLDAELAFVYGPPKQTLEELLAELVVEAGQPRVAHCCDDGAAQISVGDDGGFVILDSDDCRYDVTGLKFCPWCGKQIELATPSRQGAPPSCEPPPEPPRP